MKNCRHMIILILLMLALGGNKGLQAQINVELASEFNISVESYLRAKLSDNWVCYQNYVGLIIIALDDEGNYGEETLLRKDDIYDFSISNNYLVLSFYDNDVIGLNTYIAVYDLATEGFPLVHEEVNQDNYQVLVNIVGDYFITGARVYPEGFITKIHSLNNFQVVASYDGLRSYERVSEDKILVGNSAEPITYGLYEVTNVGELELLYSFNQYYESAIIDANSLALKDREKIDFFTITESDSLIFNGSYDLPYLNLAAYKFYYQDGIIGYNRFSYDEYCYLDLVDVSDVQNPIVLEPFNYFTMTDPDEIEYAVNALIMSNGNNIYTSLGNKPLIHLQVEDDNSVSFVEMVEGFRYSSYSNNIRNDKMFMQDGIYLQTTDISDPYNPFPVVNNYPMGRYQWFNTEDGVYCTRNYPDLDYLYIYKLATNDQLIIQDSVSVQQSNNVSSIYFDGSEFIYYSEGVVTSISYTDEGVVENWSISNLNLWCYNVYVDGYLYSSNMNDIIYIYHIEDNSPEFLGAKSVSPHSFFWVDETERFLILKTLNGSKIFDLTQDPINLNVSLDIVVRYLDSDFSYLSEYIMFIGQTIYDSNDGYADRSICIYKENEEGLSYFDSIPLPYNCSTLKILFNEDSNELKLVLTGMNGTLIFAGSLTPNGDLEINPVPLSVNNYPNPFNPETIISYNLSKKGDVQLDIFNLKGQKVKTLIDEVQDLGNHNIIWKGDNQDGKKVSSGVYLYKLKADGKEIMKKMTLIK